MGHKSKIKDYAANRKMVLSHFYGRLIRAPKLRCVGYMCKIHNVLTVEVNRSESDHLQVIYP